MIDKHSYVGYLYNKLPAVYREEDSKLGSPLYRYLECLCAGGFEQVIEDSNNFLTLIDPEKCPAEFFPYLYESFGLTYYQDIPVEYHRKFLSNLGALMKRRGTKTAIRYLVSTLTGFEVDLSYERRYNEEGECIGRFLNVAFLVNSIEEAISVTPSAKVIEQFIQSQLPFYITPSVSALVSTSVLSANDYKGCVVSSQMTAKVYPFEREKEYSFSAVSNTGVCICMAQHQVLTPNII